MTIEAGCDADLADLYRRGLTQIALSLAGGRDHGTLHAGDDDCRNPHTLRGVFTVEAQQPRPPSTTQENQQ
ncbi:hypothetical protein D3C85_1935400 [compost metagenome]